MHAFSGPFKEPVPQTLVTVALVTVAQSVPTVVMQVWVLSVGSAHLHDALSTDEVCPKANSAAGGREPHGHNARNVQIRRLVHNALCDDAA